MAALHSDGFNRDAARMAPAFGLTTRQVAADLGIVHSTLGKAVTAFSDQAKISDVETPADALDADVANDTPLRVLIVDDDVLILMNSVEMLEDLGYGVTSANSGAKALKILEADTMYDLLITDFSMPRMNGLQLAMAVRAFLPKLPILLATGYTELPEKSGLALPQLSKPYLQSDLQGAIEDMVTGTGLR